MTVEGGSEIPAPDHFITSNGQNHPLVAQFVYYAAPLQLLRMSEVVFVSTQ